MPPGTDMVCYADDTLVLAGGRGWYETQRLAETAVACAVRAIRRLGLNVSPTKSEALGFFDHRTRGALPPELCVDIDGEEVPVRSQTRYLGLTIDNGWTFGPHFDILVPKVTAAANTLCGLLPNIGGAGTGVRRLYEGPDLAAEATQDDRYRIARGYRTISHASASVLAASPLFELQALALQQVYNHLRDPGSGDGETQPTNMSGRSKTSGGRQSEGYGKGGALNYWRKTPRGRTEPFAPSFPTGRPGGTAEESHSHSA
ncbi:uncharacterized protein [Bombus fervidus]|uniref:uncharacterized protein n=1 Tax=Bombus fervidus TaxID=203811 RepID=UPI003AB5907F